MVGEMKKIFCLLCLLTCVGASHAATMCVPDLSTCESCTDFEVLDEGKIVWRANCCGVPVAGFWGVRHVSDALKRSSSMEELAGLNLMESVGYNICVMLSPFVASYGVIVGWSGGVDVSRAYSCDGFIPRCAFTYCDEVVARPGGGVLSGGAD